ncbi:expressed unknown protein [Seminavis robusta]|uniref:Uncharacterized protein n=1 Tax=Seminavis robusta TaxID=568900 RepID=A0A9N8DWZ0_9STRA|nr:expressed unknown protein [Seminavis robusta]|eukprot:Sro427_g140600.1 n/a (394) ;mRNA; f:14609-15790
MLLRRIFRSVKKRMKKVVKKPKEAAVSTTTTTCTSSTTTTTSSSSVTTHKASSHPKRTSVAPLPSSSSPSSSNNNVFRSHSDLLLLKKSNGSAFHPPSSAKTRSAGAFPTTPSNTNARPLPPLSSAKPNKYAASSSTSSFYQSPSSAFSSVLAPPPTDTKPYHKINHNHSYSTATTATTTSTTTDSIHHPRKPRKQVCFGYIMEHRYVKPPTRTKAQRKALWYSSKEIKAMRVEICVQRKKQKKHLVNKEEKAKHERRRDFVRSFLYFCNDLGVSDPRALAVFAATNSLNDRQRALVLARSDAHDACRIYHDFIMSPDGAEAAAARFFFGQPSPSSQRSLVSPSNLHQSKQGVSIAPPRRERLPPKSLESRHLQTRPSVVTAHKVLTFQCAFL